MKFLFILEYNDNVGFGHFDRCLNLAHKLIEAKHDCIFLNFNSKIKFLKTYNISKKILFKKIPYSIFELNNLGKFYHLVNKFEPDFLIFDSYKINYSFLKKINSFGFRTIVIADIEGKYFCDILINPNSEKKFFNYKKNSQSLSGLPYQLIKKEYFKRDNKNFSKINKNILVFLGSSKKKINIDSLISRINKINNQNFKYKIISKKNYKLHYPNVEYLKFLPQNKLIDEIDKSAFIISAGGTFLPKCLSKKKIVFVIKTASNQNELIKYLKEKKLIIYVDSKYKNLNNNNIAIVRSNIKYLENNILSLNKVESNFKSFLIKLRYINNELILIKKNFFQCKQIFEIQSENGNRKYSFSNKKINFNDHKVWFYKMIINKFHYHFLIKKNNYIIGLVSFKLSKGRFIISIIIKNKYRKKGFAYNAIKMSLLEKGIYKKKIIAYVDKNNINSVKLFNKLNFKLKKKSKFLLKKI